ncbi:hypothetical protein L5G28_07755 [Gordonia sp. HY285]|uniref:hypothetical protein n=1 Tax=Gordonia liuliyuniae TaxID=2911517 RepID=UPI001F20CE79|nr:hypothetical protein [Gordonia liuliyuniae]MCF8610056.1 hypothetical protein [Gordonia liuliyuniae]
MGGCNCSNGRRIIVHEVHNGSKVKRYLTEAEARKEVARNGGRYAQIAQVAK